MTTDPRAALFTLILVRDGVYLGEARLGTVDELRTMGHLSEPAQRLLVVGTLDANPSEDSPSPEVKECFEIIAIFPSVDRLAQLESDDAREETEHCTRMGNALSYDFGYHVSATSRTEGRDWMVTVDGVLHVGDEHLTRREAVRRANALSEVRFKADFERTHPRKPAVVSTAKPGELSDLDPCPCGHRREHHGYEVRKTLAGDTVDTLAPAMERTGVCERLGCDCLGFGFTPEST